jgi:hypothetical protein
VEKKTLSTAILISALLMSAVAGTQFNKAKAETLGPPTFLSTESASSDILFISSPQNTTYNSHSILVNFTVTVPNAINEVGYSVDNGSIQRITNLVKVSEESVPYGTILLPPYIRVTYMGTFVLNGLSEGNHWVTIYQGYQYTGRWARYEIAVWATAEFLIDTGPPILKILEIGPNTSSQEMPLNFTINEPSSWMAYSLDQQTNITISGNTTLAGLSGGSHSLIVYANDTVGNMGVSETIKFTIALVIQVLSPERRTYDTSSIPLNFTVNSALAQITYCLNGEKNSSVSGNTTLTGLANGDYALTVYAKDEAGNVGTSETILFTVNVPFPTTLVIVSVITVAIIGIALLVYFRKRRKESGKKA